MVLSNFTGELRRMDDLVHKLYGYGVINTFMLSSTWLTVTMAVSRYIAICHPLRARQIIGKTFTIASLVAVFVVSVLFNVPRFLFKEQRSVVVDGDRRIYFAFPGPLERLPRAEVAYLWSYFTLGIVVHVRRLPWTAAASSSSRGRVSVVLLYLGNRHAAVRAGILQRPPHQDVAPVDAVA